MCIVGWGGVGGEGGGGWGRQGWDAGGDGGGQTQNKLNMNCLLSLVWFA